MYANLIFPLILLVLICIVLCVDYWKNRKFYQLAKRLYSEELSKALPSLPLLGIAHHMIGNGEKRYKTTRLIQDIINNYCKGIAGVWFGPKFYLMVTDPEIADILLKSCLEKDEMYHALFDIIGNANLIAPVHIWRHRRRTLIPTFSPRILNAMVHTFAKTSTLLATKLQDKAGKGPFPLGKYFLAANFDSLCDNILGIQLNAQQESNVPFLNAAQGAMDLATLRTTQPWLQSDFVYHLTQQYKKQKECSDFANNFILQVIRKKREEIQKLSDSGEKPESRTFLEQLMESSTYTEVELLEETLLLALAGSETTALSSGFVMLMLARHPERQNKVYEEVMRVLGDSDKAIEASDLHELVYMEAFVKETLRLYTPGLFSSRKVTKDVKLPSGLTVPEGSRVMVHFTGVNRNPAYWGPDADLFRPERFLDTPLKHPAQYMPFSFGPRNCPGIRYAMLSIKTTIATLLRQYRVLPPTEGEESLRLTTDVLLRDVDNFIVSLETRK